MQDRARAANHRSGIGIGEIDAQQSLGGSAVLRDPGRAAVCGVDDGAEKKADRGAVVIVGKLDRVKPVISAAGLTHPVRAAVGRAENDSFLAHERAGIGVAKIHAEEIETAKRIRHAAILVHPGLATISRAKDIAGRIIVAHRGPGILVGKGDTVEKLESRARLGEGPGAAAISSLQ